MQRLTVMLLLLSLVAAEPVTAEDGLSFHAQGAEVSRLSRERILRDCPLRVVEVDDPYYGRSMRFHACPLAWVVEQGFGREPASLAREMVLFRALDGYKRLAEGPRLGEEGGFLALGDADRGTAAEAVWLPIGRERADPGPYYLVWTGADQGDPHVHPWPYQLASVELVEPDEEFPAILPRGLPRDDSAWRGLAIFRRDCLTCHAVNGQGGVVGPEMNLPRSIVEYRDPVQLKEFIRDPQSFRYTRMPANPQLSDQDLDDLLAYFGAMRERKQEVGGGG